MFNLQKHEKVIMLFLILTLALGLVVAMYKRSNCNTRVNVEHGAGLEGMNISGEHSPAEGRKININEASTDELMKIKGVGKVLAGRIVDYRAQKGLFISTEDIKKVKGIGPAFFERIKDRISVE